MPVRRQERLPLGCYLDHSDDMRRIPANAGVQLGGMPTGGGKSIARFPILGSTIPFNCHRPDSGFASNVRPSDDVEFARRQVLARGGRLECLLVIGQWHHGKPARLPGGAGSTAGDARHTWRWRDGKWCLSEPVFEGQATDPDLSPRDHGQRAEGLP